MLTRQDKPQSIRHPVVLYKWMQYTDVNRHTDQAAHNERNIVENLSVPLGRWKGYLSLRR